MTPRNCPHCGGSLKCKRAEKLSLFHRRSYASVVKSGVRGLTDDEIDAMFGWGHQVTTPRMVYLRRIKAIKWKRVGGKRITRETRKGHEAFVNVVVPGTTLDVQNARWIARALSGRGEGKG